MSLPTYNSDPTHLRDLLALANLGQREFAGILEINERSARHWFQGNNPIPEPAYYVLYFLAWFCSKERPN